MKLWTVVLITCVLPWAAFVFYASVLAPEKTHPAPAPLCATVGRFPPDQQEVWDFWMGPYQVVPCKWLTEKVDV